MNHLLLLCILLAVEMLSRVSSWRLFSARPLFQRGLSSGTRIMNSNRKARKTSSLNSNKNYNDAPQTLSSSSSRPYRKHDAFVPFPFEYHEIVELKIEDLTNLGMGIGRVPLLVEKDNGDTETGAASNATSPALADSSIKTDWVIMVPRVIPGEVVKARIYANYKNYSDADLVEVVRPSPERIEPPCPYFARCGGCQYQHMPVSLQREYKRDQVITILQRIGKIANAKDLVQPIVGSDDHTYGYRSKIQPHYNVPKNISREQPIEEQLRIGFQEYKSNRIIDMKECIIATPKINQKLAEVRDEIHQSISLHHSSPPKPGDRKRIGATILLKEVDNGHVTTDSNELVFQTVNGIRFQYKAGEFFQNNPFALPLLIDHVIKQALKSSNPQCQYLVDAYCGCGLFALSAAKHFQDVYGVEVSLLSIKAAQQSARLNNINNAHFFQGDSKAIFSRISHLKPQQTVVVIDPPRTGCDESFLLQLCTFRPNTIIYVSCDPATQARDSRFILSSGYKIIDITPFDLFPQTRHIENVITFQLSP